MTKSFYLENISTRQKENPRQFLKPTESEISNLKVGELVRLFFVFNFETGDNCRAERMWVRISEKNNKDYKGYLTNAPRYIKDLAEGDLIEFNKDNIATIIVAKKFDETKKAIITKRALENRQINWVMRGELNNPQDSGWQFFYGNEDDNYLGNPENSKIATLGSVLEFEPKLEEVFLSNGNGFDWSDKQNKFIENRIFNNPDAILEQARKDQAEMDKRKNSNGETKMSKENKKWWQIWK